MDELHLREREAKELAPRVPWEGHTWPLGLQVQSPPKSGQTFIWKQGP